MPSGDDGRGLVDAHGRRLEYLRLSVTERCNFRCRYCRPDGAAGVHEAPPLRLDEISRLLDVVGALGFERVRVTGGEPTLRPDVVEIVARVAATPGVRHVGLTTNGWRLRSLVRDLADAGLTCLNVSVDSLDPVRFASITGAAVLPDVLDGISAALATRIPRVKVNAVLLASTDAREVERFLAWTRGTAVTVRFIELMDVGADREFFARHHAPASAIERLLADRGWARRPRARGAGPSIEFRHPDHAGHVGVIAPWRHSACVECNRLRVSSTGAIRPCLFDAREIPIRHLLRSDDQASELTAAIRAAADAKPAGHGIAPGAAAVRGTLAAIGG